MMLFDLEGDKVRCKNEIARYERRIAKLEVMVSSIDNAFSDNVSYTNKQLKKCHNELANAIKGVRSVSKTCSGLEEYRERYSSSDKMLMSCRSNLNSEIRRCNNKIIGLEDEISSINTRIANFNSQA